MILFCYWYYIFAIWKLVRLPIRLQIRQQQQETEETEDDDTESAEGRGCGAGAQPTAICTPLDVG